MSNKMHIKLKVNGKDEEFLAEPRELLIYTLRERLNITGPHIGCETSHCGACTVTIDGKSVKSCTVFVAQADGADITTGITNMLLVEAIIIVRSDHFVTRRTGAACG